MSCVCVSLYLTPVIIMIICPENIPTKLGHFCSKLSTFGQLSNKLLHFSSCYDFNFCHIHLIVK